MTTRPLSDEELVQRLGAHPQIRNRIASLLAIAGDESGDLTLADDAEARVIEEMRRMGQEILQAWAEGQVVKASQEMERTSRTWREGKKNCAGTRPMETSR